MSLDGPKLYVREERPEVSRSTNIQVHTTHSCGLEFTINSPESSSSSSSSASIRLLVMLLHQCPWCHGYKYSTRRADGRRTYSTLDIFSHIKKHAMSHVIASSYRRPRHSLLLAALELLYVFGSWAISAQPQNGVHRSFLDGPGVFLTLSSLNLASRGNLA